MFKNYNNVALFYANYVNFYAFEKLKVLISTSVIALIFSIQDFFTRL